MGWNYAYTSSIWPPIIAILLLIGMSHFIWLRRKAAGGLPLLIWVLFGLLTLIGAVLKAAAIDPATKISAYIFRDIWLLPAVTASACFVLEFAWPGRWLSRRNLTLLMLPILLSMLIGILFPTPLMWRQLEIGLNGSVIAQLAPLGVILTTYGYGLFLVNLYVLVWLFIRSPQLRWPAALILAAQILVRCLFALHMLRIPMLSPPVFDVISILLPGLAYIVALFGFHILNPVSLAYRVVIDQLHSGMLVLDLDQRVIHLNPAAEKLLKSLNGNRSLGKFLRQPIQNLLPDYPSRLPDDDKTIEIDIDPEAESHDRSYSLSISMLKDWRGLDVAHLLLLRDVTEQKHVQAQLIEQQRALATLKERNQLARELHDELAQELALINVQAQLVAGLLESGQTEQARRQLMSLTELARETQVDVRGQVGKLSLGITPDEGFLGALQGFMVMFQQMYGIKTDLALLGDHSEASLTPTAELQLLRIVQEAFTNIRKHARAKQVKVALERDPGQLVLRIEDDGVGFVSNRYHSHGRSFGLSIMADRAREIDGKLEVQSIPGEGTTIVVTAPLNITP